MNLSTVPSELSHTCSPDARVAREHLVEQSAKPGVVGCIVVVIVNAMEKSLETYAVEIVGASTRWAAFNDVGYRIGVFRLSRGIGHPLHQAAIPVAAVVGAGSIENADPPHPAVRTRTSR